MLDEEAKGTSVEKASVSYTEDAVDSSKYVEMQRRHGRVVSPSEQDRYFEVFSNV